MATRVRRSLVHQIRRSGLRLHSGPWTLYVGDSGKRLVVSLGRTAGPAVARSRIRRIARSVFADRRLSSLDVTLLLTARAFVGEVTRTQLRADFSRLLDRVQHALARKRETVVP
jgi:ribonuclease P protein component